ILALFSTGAQLLGGGVAVGGPAAALVVVVEIAPAALQVEPVGRHLHEAVAVLAGEALVPDEVIDIAVELAGQAAFAIAGEGAVDLLALLAQLHAAPGGVPDAGEADAGGERIRLGVHAGARRQQHEQRDGGGKPPHVANDAVLLLDPTHSMATEISGT